jgi:hypothetical protein
VRSEATRERGGMSLPKEDRRDRTSSGKVFPSERFADAIAAALHRQYGGANGGVKAVVYVTGATERAVKNWFQAKNGPNGEFLIKLCRHSDSVLETVLLLAGREEQVKVKKIATLKAAALQMLELINELESNGRS